MTVPKARWLLVVAVVASALAVIGCSDKKKSPEELIRAQLDQGTAALSEGDVKGAAAVLADDYKDGKGRDKKTLKRITFFVLRGGPITLKRTDETIEVDDDGERAVVSAKVWAVQTSKDKKVVADLIPRARAVEEQIGFTLIDGEWLVTSLEGDPYGAGYGG
jgi:hypothetical protein